MFDKTEEYDKRRIDQAPRQEYYGAGRQPWDDIVASGWGPAFAASNVLKYLRRNKISKEEDIKKAIWYYTRLREMCAPDRSTENTETWVLSWRIATLALAQLTNLLNMEELSILAESMKDDAR